MMSKIITQCILLLVLIFYGKFSAASELASKETIKVLILSGEFPPYSTRKIKNGGLMFDALLAYTKKHQLPVNYDFAPYVVPTARAERIMGSGEWCISMHTMQGKKNLPYIMLDMPHVALGLYRLAESTPFDWQSINELSGKSISVLRVSDEQPVMKRLTQAGAQLVSVDSLMQSYQMVMIGRVNYSLGDSLSYQYYRENGLIDGPALQFSEKMLARFPLPVWLNPECESVAHLIPKGFMPQAKK